jgi:hypothetical protein
MPSLLHDIAGSAHGSRTEHSLELLASSAHDIMAAAALKTKTIGREKRDFISTLFIDMRLF